MKRSMSSRVGEEYAEGGNHRVERQKLLPVFYKGEIPDAGY
jgi:hypothetical protein